MLQSKFWVFLWFVIGVSTSSITESSLCKSDNDCLINSTICKNSSCECIEGYIFSGDRTKCFEVAKSFGDACEESQQCSEFLFTGGTCNKGFCDCASGYHYLHGQCWKSLNLGDKCLSPSNCYVNYEVGAAECRENVCQCSDGYYHREYRSCRRKATGEGADCVINLDCQYEIPENVRCDNTNKCVTLSNTTLITDDENYEKTERINRDDSSHSHDEIICERAHFYSKTMKKCIAEIGEPCKNDETPLIKHSICQDNYWKCKISFVPMKNNRICKKAKTAYRQQCVSNEECYLFGPDAECRLHQCICNSKSHFIKDQLFCWINKQPGEKCESDNDCYDYRWGIESKCINNICNCPIGYHINSKNQCVQDVKAIGDRCTESEDCKPITNTTCSNNICACVNNYYEADGKCVPGIKTPCDNFTICKPENSYCKSGLCTCRNKFVEISAGLCAPIADNGENCTDSLQCTTLDPNSHCSNAKRICACQDMYFYNYGRCFKRKILSESCDSIGECFVRSHPSSVICKNGICVCNQTKKLDETYCGNDAMTVSISTWMTLIVIMMKSVI